MATIITSDIHNQHATDLVQKTLIHDTEKSTNKVFINC